jgi:uncharacterized repeat protein (TIGR03806 family)
VNHQIFLSFTADGVSPKLRTVIARYGTNADGSQLELSSETPILDIEQAGLEHHGGHIEFGPDGALYLGLGDSGVVFSAQDPSVLLGKIVRCDVDKGPPYTAEVFARGFRNPWQWHFDPGGTIWAGDVGTAAWEEIDQVERAGNYGWPLREGAHCSGLPGCGDPTLRDPVLEHPHGAEASCIIGGYVYRGVRVASLQGAYVYTDYVTGNLYAAFADSMTGKLRPSLLNPKGPFLHPAALGESVDGELYVVDHVGAAIYAMVPAAVAPADTFPQHLSDTGCFDPKAPQKSLQGLVPYDVASPQWTDGADKERLLSIPDGARIHVGADGHWDLPIGSVVFETFRKNGRPVETRMLVRHQDGEWSGYSYEWTDDGSDARLLGTNDLKPVDGDELWYFPARSQCPQCHTEAAGRTLGLETAQLNHDFEYAPGRRANQLVTLSHIGLIDREIIEPSKLDALRTPTARDVSLESRARAYLHANCSSCHRPGGDAGGALDLRYATSWRATGACDGAPMHGALGVANARVVAPGDPTRSVLLQRVRAVDVARMPPLATQLVDIEGAGVLDEWIRSLSGCPSAAIGASESTVH